MFPFHKNELIDLLFKSIEWFLCDGNSGNLCVNNEDNKQDEVNWVFIFWVI